MIIDSAQRKLVTHCAEMSCARSVLGPKCLDTNFCYDSVR